MICKKSDCPIFESCDQEKEQAYYCRKIEILLNLSKLAPAGTKPSMIAKHLPTFLH